MARIFDGVILGDGVLIDETAFIGVAPVGVEEGALETVIGPGAVIRSHTVIYAGVQIGARLSIGHGAMIREENVIGDDVSIGTNAVLEFGTRLGTACACTPVAFSRAALWRTTCSSARTSSSPTIRIRCAPAIVIASGDRLSVGKRALVRT
jgi:UDP-3-O-[3-hydroxymyristoyl] glucosamine N-acyltransferase